MKQKNPPNLYRVMDHVANISVPVGTSTAKALNNWSSVTRKRNTVGTENGHLPTRQFIKMDRLIPVSAPLLRH
jgi:hypothetical protein